MLTRSLDELPPQTRRFLTVLEAWITTESAQRRVPREAFRFLAREARAVTGLGPTQVKLHLHRLVDLEYVVVHRAARGQGITYELLVDGGGPSVEAGELRALLGYDPERSDFRDSGRPLVGPRSGGGRTPPDAANPASRLAFAPERSESAPQHLNGRRSRSHVA